MDGEETEEEEEDKEMTLHVGRMRRDERDEKMRI